jgi:hypothetical protein
MAGKGGGKGGSSGQASNADLQDDEDVMNRMWRGKHFRDWAKMRRGTARPGMPINYDKSPMPPKK